MIQARCFIATCISLLASSAGAVAASEKTAAAATPDQLKFFESKIRPALAEHCYQCHSTEAKKLKGGLYLDRRDGVFDGGDSGPAVVAGDPDKSILIEAVRYGNEDTAMPPKQKLPAAVIADFEAWVKMGAPWPAEQGAVARATGPDYQKLKAEHWSYQPIGDPAPPPVKDAGWVRNDVDRFILAALEAKGIKPAADADRVNLLRRVYFDLVGLPPTPEQIDAFVADPSPDAFEKRVEELLASPHFGERWGRHWLDVARFAESYTLRGFVVKDAWKYRDYVIEQFNTDRPFDQFMQEQVAGDLIAADPAAKSDLETRRRQMHGSTFLTLGNYNLEEQDKGALRMDVVDEQLDTFGKAFLGQTIGCARCHDHKFDPITAADYYALAGIFRNARTLEEANVSKWLEVPLPGSEEAEQAIAGHNKAVAALQNKIKQVKVEIAAAAKGKDFDKLPSGGSPAVVSAADLAGVVIDDAQAKKVGEWKVTRHTSGFIGEGYSQDLNVAKGEKSITFQPEALEPGKYEVRLAYTPGPNRATNTPVTIFSADGEKTIEINQQVPPTIDGRFISLGQYGFEKNGAGFVLVGTHATDGFVIADAVQFIPVAELARLEAAGPTALKVPADKRAEKVVSADQTAANTLKILESELKALQAAAPRRDTIVSVLEEAKIEDARIHIRGNVHNLGPVVPRGYLSAFEVKGVPAPSADQSGRRELGQWVASPQNPLPARVMANRVWHWLMGQGIVRTVDNFGTTGEAPSHPALLDHLASRFIRDNWSVKSIVRQIVLSRTYQLACVQDSAAAAIDPENRLCWRANRQRLDGESMRDAMLVVSGQLDRTMGGQTFKAGTNADYNYKFTEPRRSVYIPQFRNSMPEMVEAFDAADPSMVSGRRNVSTVAPQALFMLNHPFVQEQSQAAAARLMAEGPADAAARADLAYRWVLGRLPTAGEKAVVLKYVNGYTVPGKTAERASWAQIFHGLFASMDFRYVN